MLYMSAIQVPSIIFIVLNTSLIHCRALREDAALTSSTFSSVHPVPSPRRARSVKL